MHLLLAAERNLPACSHQRAHYNTFIMLSLERAILMTGAKACEAEFCYWSWRNERAAGATKNLTESTA